MRRHPACDGPDLQTEHAMRITRDIPMTLTLMALALAGCAGGGDDIAGPSSDLDPNVAPVTVGSWYRPGVNVTWQWQLDGTINTGYDVDIYDVDLFETPDAVLQQLRSGGARILCYFSAGSSESSRPDFGSIPTAALGQALDGYPNERWLDIRSRAVLDVMVARLDLAMQRGCDGVEPDNIDGFTNATGFPLSGTDQLAFNRNLANEAHRRGLTIALKNDGDQAAELVDYFDLELNEQCHQYDECDQLQPFLDRSKPVLNAEYATGAPRRNRWREPCARAPVAPTLGRSSCRTISTIHSG
jgi:hypothetical protein